MKKNELTSDKPRKKGVFGWPCGSVKRGRPVDPNRVNLTRKITLLLTEAEWQNFEALRFAYMQAPTRSQWARFLVVDGIDRRRRKDVPGCVPRWVIEEGGAE